MLLPVKKKDSDYMGRWDGQKHIGSNQGAVDTFSPSKIIFRSTSAAPKCSR